MPPRLTSLTLRFSAHECPILTFLAPRVFAPWPVFPRGRRALGTSLNGTVKPQTVDRGASQEDGLQQRLDLVATPSNKEEDPRSGENSSQVKQTASITKDPKSSEANANVDPVLLKYSLKPSDEQSLAESPISPPPQQRASLLKYYNSLIQGNASDEQHNAAEEYSGKANMRQMNEKSHLKLGLAASGSLQQRDSSEDPDFWKAYQSIWAPSESLFPVAKVTLAHVRRVTTGPRQAERPSNEREQQLRDQRGQQRISARAQDLLSYNAALDDNLQDSNSLHIDHRPILSNGMFAHAQIKRYLDRSYTPTIVRRGARLRRDYLTYAVASLHPTRRQKQVHLATASTSRVPIIRDANSPKRRRKTFSSQFYPSQLPKSATPEHQARWRGRFFSALRAFEARRWIAASMHPDQVVGPKMNSFVRLGPEDLSKGGFNSRWNINFSNIKMEAEFGFPPHRSERNLRNLSARILPFWDIPCEAITQKWLSLPESHRRHVWRSVMITLLPRDHTAALKFLVATCFAPYPPGYAVTDSLEFIVGRFLAKEDKRRPKNVESLLSILIRLLDHVEQDYFHLNDRTIRSLLRFLNGEQLSRFYEKLIQCNHPLHPLTTAHLITAFAETKQTRMALECMRWLRGKNWVDFSSPVFEAVCSTLLQHKNRTPSPDAPSDAEIFSLMLDCGLRPNIITYNILLRNAIESGDSDTALQIHSMMTENGHIPNGHTYAILLNDAKRRLARDEVYHIFDIAARSEMLNSNSVTDFIHATYLMAEVDERATQVEAHIKWKDSLEFRTKEPPFKRMLDMYSRFFDTAPLWELIPNYPALQMTDETKWEPSKPLLVIMLIALLKELNSNVAIQFVYDKLRELITKQHPSFKAFAHSTHAYDAIVMAFGKSDETLRRCTSVIRHMIVSHAHNHSHVAPSVRTWSILLKAFMDHRQPRAAEKVLNMMQERGIAPNIVTWNSLTAGYARLQDTPNALKAVERMQSEGWQLDEVGLRGLQNLQDREAILSALKAQAAGMTQRQRDADKYSVNLVRKIVRKGQFIALSKAAPLKATGEEDMPDGEAIDENQAAENEAVENQDDAKSMSETITPINVRDLVFPFVDIPSPASREEMILAA